MYKFLFSLLSLSFFLTSTSGLVHSTEQSPPKKTIVWNRAYFPPVTIPSGPNAERGFFDNVMNFIIKNMPEYTHEQQTANFKRIMNEMKKEGNSCCPSLYKNAAREQFISFSIPAVVVLPNGLITTEKNRDKLKPYLNKNGKISLTRLMDDSSLTLGVSSGRIYSGGIDAVLKQHQSDQNIYTRSGADVFKGLLAMLFLGRIDYTIGYPTEAQYFSQEKTEYRSYIFYPIEESGIPFTLGYIGCPKTTWGAEVIKNVDGLLIKHRHTELFLSFYESWLDDATKPMYRSIVNAYFDSENN